MCVTFPRNILKLLNGGGGLTKKIDEERCVPFVSQYSDCSGSAMCTDCTLCTCNAQGKWECKPADTCNDVFRFPPLDEDSLQQTFNVLEQELEINSKKVVKKNLDHVVPTPEDDAVLDQENEDSIEHSLKALLRSKRSAMQMKGDEINKSISFYHTIDDIDEDTLKNNNETGTLLANKMNLGIKMSRRTDVFNHNNTNSLQIKHKKAIHHITDNKIDDNVDPQIDDTIHKTIGNMSLKTKDKTLSKLIVNELKPGTEIIGDKKTPVISNITFASENDTLMAMAYIAGNLLNKLWNMEKDTSSDSFETEVLKHEKISDLVELFKEPLSLRQETFLKNALEQLSSVINKNKDGNLTICESLMSKETLKEEYGRAGKEKKKCTKLTNEDKTENVSKEAVDKIVNVLNLINKYDQVQKNLTEKTNKINGQNIKKMELESKLELLSNDETASLNIFGGILEKITKLLLPNKRGNKVANKIKYQNLFSHTNDFKNKFKTLYNLDLGNMTISTKDKLIMDYLTHIEKNPDCLLNEKSHRAETKSLPELEGNILLNLSEFFKIQSYTDILHLLNPEMKKITALRKNEYTEKIDATIGAVDKKVINSTDDEKLHLAKQKLKEHLKTVLEDIISLQNATNDDKGTNVNVADALPCIYKILNEDNSLQTRRSDSPLRNIKAVFDYLKNEIQLPNTRRSNTIKERPKSAVVWERVLNNLNLKIKRKSRRNLEIETKSFNEIKEIIDRSESSTSNTYKHIALLAEVPAADRLVLLQTLAADVKKYIKILEDMKSSIESNTLVPLEILKDFIEFTDNAATNINLNKKIVKNVNKPKTGNIFSNQIGIRKEPYKNKIFSSKKEIKFTDSRLAEMRSDNNVRLTRDQILNHLIKNRIKVYLKAKEAEDSYVNYDFNYGIAKKVLMYLEQGNDALAREFFKIFIASKENDSKKIGDPTKKIEKQVPFLSKKVPLIQFDEPKTALVNQDIFKQLLTLKSM